MDVTVWNASISFAAAIISPPGGSCLFLWKGFVAARPEHPVVALAIQLQLETLTWSKTALSTVWDTTSKTCASPLHHEWRRRAETGGCCFSRPEINEDFPSHVLGKAFRDIAGRSEVRVVPDDDLALFGSQATPSPKDRSLLLLVSVEKLSELYDMLVARAKLIFSLPSDVDDKRRHGGYPSDRRGAQHPCCVDQFSWTVFCGTRRTKSAGLALEETREAKGMKQFFVDSQTGSCLELVRIKRARGVWKRLALN